MVVLNRDPIRPAQIDDWPAMMACKCSSRAKEIKLPLGLLLPLMPLILFSPLHQARPETAHAAGRCPSVPLTRYVSVVLLAGSNGVLLPLLPRSYIMPLRVYNDLKDRLDSV